MKKFLTTFLLVSFVFSGLPVHVWSAQIVQTSPIYVRAMELNREVTELKKDVLNQERANRDEEIMARQLAEENTRLLEYIQARQPGALVDSIKTMRELKEALQEYGRRLDNRNQSMIARNEDIGALKARIEKLEHLFDEVIRLTKNVEAMKNPSPEQIQGQEALVLQLQEQQEALLLKNKELQEKYQQLLEYKNQMSDTKVELQKLQPTTDDAAIAKTEEFLKTIESLKARIKDISARQEGLADQDVQLKKLEDVIFQKDTQIAELKSQLTAANEQLLNAKKEITAKETLIADQEKILTSQDKIIQGLNLDMSKIKGDIDVLHANYDHYDTGFERIRENIVALKNKLADAQVKAGMAENNEKDLIAAKGDIAALTYQLQTAQEDLNEYQKQMQDKDEAIRNLNDQIALKEQALTNKNEEILKLQSQVEKAADYKSMVEHIKDNLTVLIKEVESLKGQVADLGRLKERAALQDTLISKYHALEDLAGQKSELLIQLAGKHQDKAEYYVDQLKKTILYWQELNVQQEKQVQVFKEELNTKQGVMDQLQKELEENKGNAAQLESMLDVYQKKMDEKDGQTKEKIVEIDRLQGELQTAQDNIDQKEKDLGKVQTYFYELEKKSSDKVTELREKNQQLALLNALLENKNQKLADISTQLMAAQQKLKNSIPQSELVKEQLVTKMLKDRLIVSQERLKTCVGQDELDQTKQFLKACSDELAGIKK